MRRRIFVVLSLLLTVAVLSLVLGLGVSTTLTPTAEAAIEMPQMDLLTTQASGCSSLPVPQLGCSREGQCCLCPCDFVGTCSSIGGQLVCACPCAQ